MSACTSTIIHLRTLLISAVSASLMATSAAGQELRDPLPVSDCSKTFHASKASPRNSKLKGDGPSSAWKQSSSRGWTASASPREPRHIKLVSATGPRKDDSSPVPVDPVPQAVTSSPSNSDRNTDRAASADSTDIPGTVADTPPLPESRPLTSTEKFKRALAEQRRVLEEQAARNQWQNNSLDMQTPLEKPQKNPGLTATVNSDLHSEDPQKRETAERFQRLKEKLAKLKLRVQHAENPEDLKVQSSGGHGDHGNTPDLNATPDQSANDPVSEHSVEHDATAMPDKHSVDSALEHSVGEDRHPPGDSHGESASKNAEQPQPGHPDESSEEHSDPIDSAHSSATEDAAHDDTANRPITQDEELTSNSEHSHAVDVETGTHDSGSSSDTKTAAVFSDKAVVDGPIDRVGLANNLYAVGEFRLAMEMYEHAEETELSPEQQIWSEYQAANCLRRLGKNGEASNRYRRLAGMAEAGWLSDQSRWWLEVLEQVRQLEKSLDSDSDPAVKPEATNSPAAHSDKSSHGAAHQSAPHSDESHESSLKATKEPTHGEHSE